VLGELVRSLADLALGRIVIVGLFPRSRRIALGSAVGVPWWDSNVILAGKQADIRRTFPDRVEKLITEPLVPRSPERALMASPTNGVSGRLVGTSVPTVKG
jgi:hypothetical protein